MTDKKQPEALRIADALERAQAAPAAVAPDGDYDALRCAVGNCTFNGGVTQHAATCPNKPTTHPAPQRETQSALFDKQGFRAWVLRNLPDDTIIGSSAYWADHLSAWAQRFVKKAPQQEAQEPVAVVTVFHDLGGEVDWTKARVIPPVGTKLYTAPQPLPASQEDALDAARYRYLRDVPMGLWPAELLSVIRLQQNAKWDAAIDAAREAQEDGQ